MTVKDIYNRIENLNPELTTVSSLGSFISQSDRMVQESIYAEVVNNIPKGSLAYKILTGSTRYTSKQIWAIAYELLKNKAYVAKVSVDVNKADAIAKQKADDNKAKLNANKQGSKAVRDFVKANGGLLKDYDAFVKSNKQFAKEFFSKKFTMESANAFLNI
mgnify:FL=1